MTKKEIYQQKRKQLIELSKPIKILVKDGAYSTVNEGLNEIYREGDPEIKEFNTFNQWKNAGKTILKGATAYLFWGQPKEVPQQETDENSTEEEKNMKYFPLCYLFSNLQVR
jgi:hypothetical protein